MREGLLNTSCRLDPAIVRCRALLSARYLAWAQTIWQSGRHDRNFDQLKESIGPFAWFPIRFILATHGNQTPTKLSRSKSWPRISRRELLYGIIQRPYSIMSRGFFGLKPIGEGDAISDSGRVMRILSLTAQTPLTWDERIRIPVVGRRAVSKITTRGPSGIWTIRRSH